LILMGCARSAGVSKFGVRRRCAHPARWIGLSEELLAVRKTAGKIDDFFEMAVASSSRSWDQQEPRSN
jgi:hypothetical protein